MDSATTTKTEEHSVLNHNVIKVKFDFSSFSATSHPPHNLLTQYNDTLINVINQEFIPKKNFVNWYLVVHDFFKLINGENVNCTFVFRTRTQIKLASGDIYEQFKQNY